MNNNCIKYKLVTNNTGLLTNNPQQSEKKPSFRGIGEIANGANKWISAENYVRGFLVLDTCGFILPRVYQASQRNREELGSPNYKAATEEALREFLSGPIIFAIPLSCFLLAKKFLGAATNIDKKALGLFSDKFEKMHDKISGTFKDVKENFYKKVLEDAFKGHLANEGISNIIAADNHTNTPVRGKNSHGVINEIKDRIIEIDKLNGEEKPKKESIGKLKEEVNNLVVYLNNKHGLLQNNKSNISIPEKINLDIKTFVEHMFNYTNDIVKKVCESTEANKKNLIETLNQKAKSRQTLLNIGAVVATAAYTSCIPLLYTRYKKFPGTEGIRPDNHPSCKEGVAK